MTGVGYVFFFLSGFGWFNLQDIWLSVFLCIVSSFLSASSFGVFDPTMLPYGWVFIHDSRFSAACSFSFSYMIS